MVEQGGHAWVRWQQEPEEMCAIDERQQKIVGMAELAARAEREHGMLNITRSSGG